MKYIKLLSRLIQGVLIISLCACAAPKQKVHDITPIDLTRNDIVDSSVAIAAHDQKFCVKPTDYNDIKTSDVDLELAEDIALKDNSLNNKTKKSHERWMKSIKNYAYEVRDHIAGSKPNAAAFDIMSIPIGVSYTIDLDKPKKKVKNSRIVNSEK